MEIWNAITIEKHSVLQITKPSAINYNLPDVLAYSPDGHSLAGCFGSVITIWDLQTGGVVEEIEHEVEGVIPTLLRWSLDGTVICATFPVGQGTWDAIVYDIVSGKEVFSRRFPSSAEPYLWLHGNSLQVMAISCTKDFGDFIIKIFNIWPPSNDGVTGSFPVKLNFLPQTVPFSPSTYKICITTHLMLLAIDIQSSKTVLREKGYFGKACFSPDGSLLAAYRMNYGTCVWKYTSEQGYVPWREFPSWTTTGGHQRSYQFSPTSSSILIPKVYFLEVQHFNIAIDPPTKSANHYDDFSTNGTYMVATPEFGSTVTITNLDRNSSQLLDTRFRVGGLALTGNILLVGGTDKFVVWRLTAEGMIDGIFDSRREGNDGRLWTKMLDGSDVWVGTTDCGIGVIELSKGPTGPPKDHIFFDTETGKELESMPFNAIKFNQPQHRKYICGGSNPDRFDRQARPMYSLSNRKFLEHDTLSARYNNPLDDSPQVPVPWYREGWVKFPEGEHRHRFWLPAHWRPHWKDARWFDGSMVLRLETDSGLVIIKF